MLDISIFTMICEVRAVICSLVYSYRLNVYLKFPPSESEVCQACIVVTALSVIVFIHISWLSGSKLQEGGNTALWLSAGSIERGCTLLMSSHHIPPNCMVSLLRSINYTTMTNIANLLQLAKSAFCIKWLSQNTIYIYCDIGYGVKIGYIRRWFSQHIVAHLSEDWAGKSKLANDWLKTSSECSINPLQHYKQTYSEELSSFLEWGDNAP